MVRNPQKGCGPRQTKLNPNRRSDRAYSVSFSNRKAAPFPLQPLAGCPARPGFHRFRLRKEGSKTIPLYRPAGDLSSRLRPKNVKWTVKRKARCAGMGRHLCRFLTMACTISSMTMGFDRCSFMPAFSEACTSSAKALAVMAMMGIRRASGRSCMQRMAAVAS